MNLICTYAAVRSVGEGYAFPPLDSLADYAISTCNQHRLGLLGVSRLLPFYLGSMSAKLKLLSQVDVDVHVWTLS